MGRALDSGQGVGSSEYQADESPLQGLGVLFKRSPEIRLAQSLHLRFIERFGPVINADQVVPFESVESRVAKALPALG